jgi:hypothetical protein
VLVGYKFERLFKRRIAQSVSNALVAESFFKSAGLIGEKAASTPISEFGSSIPLDADEAQASPLAQRTSHLQTLAISHSSGWAG